MKSALANALKRLKKAKQLSYKAMAKDTSIDKNTLKAYVKGKTPFTKNDIDTLQAQYNLEYYKNHDLYKKHTPKSLKSLFSTYNLTYDKKRRITYIKAAFSYVLSAFKKDALVKTIFLLLMTALFISWITTYYIIPLIITSALVPLVLLLLIYPLMKYETLELVTAIKLFLLGGVASISMVILVGAFIPITGTVLDHLLTGFLEEVMKLFVVYIALKHIKSVTMMKGLLIGFIVGAAVDIFETMEYGIWNLYETDFDWLSMQLLVLLRSGYTILLGHHYMTAILAAVMVYIKKRDYTTSKDFTNPVVIQMVVIVSIIHASWNAFAVNNNLLFMFITGFTNFFLFLIILKIAYVESYYNQFINLIPNRPIPLEDDNAHEDDIADNYGIINSINRSDLMKADLHMHTTDSDGRLSGEKLFEYAASRGVDMIAITDHDVCKNVETYKELAKEHGIAYIPGIELSTLYDNKNVHLLGYFRDDAYNSDAMKTYYTMIKEGRENRAKTFIVNLKIYYDIEIHYNDILEASDGIIARPHIAKAIMKRYPEYSHNEIFEKFIGDHTKAYVPSTELSLEEGIKLLRDHNALVVLAHPKLLKSHIHDDVLAHDFDGIEAIYGMNTEEETAFYKSIAKDKGWLITAGSDFHGIINDKKHKNVGDVTLEGNDLQAFLDAINYE
ncbi:MAG: PrsW family glutamic-type intramembrane protease [Bacillota bacterium]